MDSGYPNELDGDRQLPRVDDNITEMGGEAINATRSAIFNIEETLGISPQGTAADLATRLSTALNPDGSLKASALAAVAVVTLPITNSMIASNADIEESKLDLDHSTVNLKSLIDWNFAEIKKLMSAVTVDIGHLASHVSHPSTWGRHHTSDIDGYTGATYDGYNLQGMVADLNTRIINHLANSVDAHDASAISFDDILVTITANNVQDAIVETDRLIEGATIIHQDNQHANGILKAQEISYGDSNHSYTLVSSSAIQNVNIGATAIQFISIPISFGLISRGDTVDITLGGIIYRRFVDTTDTTNAIINFFNPIPVSGSGATAVIYKNSAEVLAPSSLNFAIRRTNVASTGGSIIQMVHPGAPYVLSNGTDPRGLDASKANIKMAWATGDTGDVDIYTLMTAFSSSPSVWTIENVSLTINEEFADQNYPIISFVYRGELGFALDEPDGYLEISSPSTNSAWGPLGFSSNDVSFALSRSFYVDGYKFNDLRTIVDAYGDIDAGDTNEITNIATNIKMAGLKASGVIRIKNSLGDDGTYIFDQVNDGDTLTISEHSFNVTNDLRIVTYADSFSIPFIPSQRTLYELFIDGYNHSSAVFNGAKRLEYTKEPSASTQDMAGFFDIVDISRDFPSGERRITLTENAGGYTIALGTRGAGASLDQSGQSISLPTPSATVVGYNFRLYDYNNVDYIELQIPQNYTIITGTQALDLIIHSRLSEERYLQVGKVLHNKTELKHLSDRRLFGNVGRKNVRDDFTRDYTSYPRSMLRGNGITHGFDLSASVGGTSFVIDGGEVLVNGILYTIPEKEFVVPKDGAAVNYNLYADTNGVLRFEKDDDINIAHFSPSVSEIIISNDKTILWYISANASNQITTWSDLRRFVVNLDNKVELIVEQNDITHGSFASLNAAFNYIELGGTFNPMPRIVRVHGTITHDITNGPLEIPSGIIMEGDATGRGYPSRGAIVNITGNGTDFLHPNPGCTVRNLNFTTEAGNTDVAVLFGGNILKDFVLENCNFYNLSTTNTYLNVLGGTGTLINALLNIYVNNCTFDFSDIDTDNTVFNAVYGYIWKLAVTNCEFDFSATDATNWGILAVGITDSVVDNCYFSYPTIGASGAIRGIQCSGWITNCHIQNNIFRNPISDDDTIAITAPLLWSCSITGNKFEKFFRNIWAGSVVAPANYIVNNRMLQVGFSGIEIENARDTYIENNYLDAYDSEPDMTLIKLRAPWFCTVEANMLVSFVESSVADGYMIRIHGSSLSNVISDNDFLNSSDLNVGFENAIVLDGEGGGTNSHLYDSITDNKITYFGGGDCQGICVRNAMHITINGNAIAATRAPLGTFDISKSIITNNIFNVIGTETVPAMKIDGSGSIGAAGLIISNNYITGSINTAHLIEITANSGSGGILSDNVVANTLALVVHGISINTNGYIITNNRLAVSTAGSAISCTGNSCTISLNSIYGVLGIGIKSTGDTCLIALNHLTNVSGGLKREISGDGTTDYMNKGATYTTELPVSCASRDERDWQFRVSSSDFVTSYVTNTGSTGDGYLIFEFSTAHVPIGSEFVKAEIQYELSGGGSLITDLTFRWVVRDDGALSQGTGSTLGSETNADVVGSLDTKDLLIPLTRYMAEGDIWGIRMDGSAAIITRNVYGVRITYVL